MNTPFPPVPPSRGRGVTSVQPLRGFRIIDLPPPWGGPAEAT
jgi:hypothetical protein